MGSVVVRVLDRGVVRVLDSVVVRVLDSVVGSSRFNTVYTVHCSPILLYSNRVTML